MISAQASHAAEFVKLLKSTLVPDNITRKDSEAKLNSIDNNTKLNLLLHVLINEKERDVLEVSALMLRQLIDRQSNVSQFDPNLLNAIKQTIPQLCLQQPIASIRNKLVDILSSLVNLIKAEHTWPEITQYFYDCLVNKNEDIGKLIAFRLLNSSPIIIDELDIQTLSNVLQIINERIINPNPLSLDAVKALTSVIVECSTKKTKQFLPNCLNSIFNLIKNSIHDDACVDLLEELNVIIECRTKLLKDYIVPILQLMIFILNDSTVTESIRVPAMEIIVCLAENMSKTFKQVAKDLFPTVIDIFLRHMMILNDDPEWNFTEKEEDDNELATEAETSLDRITCAIGGKLLFPIIMEQITPLFNSKVWQHRCAALTTISCIAEGFHKTLKPYLPSVVDAIAPFMRDEHPRVIYACINAIGQLCVDYETYFQQNFHKKLFPLVFAAATYSIPKLQAHALCCFVNLLEGCPQDIIMSYSDQIFSILRDSLITSINRLNNPGSALVMENSLSSIAKLASEIKTEFVRYYPKIVPELIALVRSFAHTTHVKYYIDSLDTLADILMSVGIDNCIQDLENVLDLLKRFEINVQLKEGGRNFQIEYLEIMADIAKIYKHNLSPILPKLMPVLLELSAQNIENQIIDTALTNELDEKMVSKAFSAHTDALADKSTILLILSKLMKILKTNMITYMDQIIDVAIKNFNEHSDSDIQDRCSGIFSAALKCTDTQVAYQQNIWIKIFHTFYARVLGNDQLFCSEKSFYGIQKCVKVIGFNGLTQEVLIKIVEIMSCEIDRIIREVGSVNKPDVSDEDEDYEDDDPEEVVLTSIHDLQHALLKLLKSNYAPFYLRFHDQVNAMCDCSNPLLRSWGVSMYCSVAEFIPNEVLNISGPILEKALKMCVDNHKGVQQAAVFLVGVVAEFSPNQQAYLNNALPVLVKIITSSSKDDDSIIIANSIFSVGKIMKFCPSLISNFDAAVKTWISWLPVVDDEVDFCLEYLLELIESKFQLIAGSGNAELFKVLDSVACMLPLSSDDVSSKAINILSQLKNHVPDSFNLWFSNLSNDNKENIQSAQSLCERRSSKQ